MEQDTSKAAQRRYHELLRQMSPVQRLQGAARLSEAVRALALLGLRQRFPKASTEELRTRLVVRLYGRDYAARVCGELPADAV